MVFLGNQRPKAAVAWLPPMHGSSGTPRGGSPARQSSSGNSAERWAHSERSAPLLAPARGPAAPEGAGSGSAAMVSPFHAHVLADSEGQLSDAPDSGLHVPAVVKQWVTSQRGMTPQSSRQKDGKGYDRGDATENWKGGRGGQPWRG